MWEAVSSPPSCYPQIIILAVLITVTHIKNRWLLHTRSRLYYSPFALFPPVVGLIIVIFSIVIKSIAVLMVEIGVQRNALLKLVAVVGQR